MSEFPECNRRGKVLSQISCECFSNRIIHGEDTIVASLQTCQICPYKSLEDDPDLPPVGEKVKGPGIVKLAGNFAKAVANHLKDGGRKVSQEELQERLEQCNNCQFLVKNRCRHMKCGCFITKKAKWRSEKCPIGRWPPLEE